MTKATEIAKTAVQDTICTQSEKLRGADYLEFLEEISSHVESLIDCYKEENSQT
jgi:hypothetical protein